jgi:hypothetical protein
MGSIQSIDNTVLGKSLIGRKFRTKNPCCFSYSCYDNVYYIKKWYDKGSPCNPKPGSFNLEVKSLIEFRIISVKKTWGIDSGDFIKVGIQITNNIPISMIGNTREAYINYKWTNRNSIDEITSNFLPAIFESNLITDKLICGICPYSFGFQFLPYKFDVNQPCIIDNHFLEEII